MPDPFESNRTGAAAAVLGAVLLIVLAAAVFGLGPCADDELSESEFISEADGLCSQAHDEFLDLQGSAPKTADDAAALMDALIQVAEEERDAISDLGAPPALEGDVERYLAAREEGIALLEEGRAAAEAEDAAEYEAVQRRLEAGQRKRFALAREVGFSECSKPLAESG